MGPKPASCDPSHFSGTRSAGTRGAALAHPTAWELIGVSGSLPGLRFRLFAYPGPHLMGLELKLGFNAKSQLLAGVWLHCPSTLRFCSSC